MRLAVTVATAVAAFPAALFTAPSGAWAAVPNSRCTGEAGLVSRQSREARRLTIVNQSRETIDVHWISFTGQRQRMAQVSPGQSYSATTYSGHGWVITNSLGACKALIFAQRTDTTFTYR